ncbi:alpha-galactosidase [Aureibaculum marinum]|uniref:Alpha-galactosidase n=1 Tax=Aureibaculum marinum TaxID=2487930 RepID=A0A3N4NJD6_9FLAO|nr:alpha-galactosidase [Aureibaculum marinum]RPD93376.1 alpha-galactosidase [Aureibaculum marinum]
MTALKLLAHKKYPFILICLFINQFVWSQRIENEIKIILEKDTLVLENQKIKAKYSWNNGNISLTHLNDKTNNKSVSFSNENQNFLLNNETSNATDSHFEIITGTNKNYKDAVITFNFKGINIKQVLRLYSDVKAIKHTYFLKGKSDQKSWDINKVENLDMIETRNNKNDEFSRIGHLEFNTRHWKFKSVKFYEATDHHDNPVEETTFLSYRKQRKVQANLLFASNTQRKQSIYILKESPIGVSQQYYPGFDFLVDYNGLSIHGLGISPTDLNDNWIQGYGYALGISDGDDIQQKITILNYQKKVNPYIFERDFMMMSNTWGDRSKDSRMNEEFILNELTSASKLGITHFQLDDGWQQGLSRNSASKSGVKWDDWSTEDWQPHKERFPNGFKKIIKTAEKENIKIGLWFNPSKTNNYANWERDANILLEYYNNFGISNFKIDGLDLMTKQAEINLRKLFSKVKLETNGKAVFNLDVTAGRRIGYHYFGEYGNIFLENRYTDWSNYYPYRTLRNLWLLASYVPSQQLQIEFLNVNRNKKKYPMEDMASPEKVGLNYAFAATMMAQPLAWMEVSQLKEIPLNFIEIVEKYKTVAKDLHAGTIIPIGQEPDGNSWTGFLSLGSGNEHYLLVFRENNQNKSYELNLPFSINKTEIILGDSIKIKKQNTHNLKLTLETPWSFSLLKISSND